MKQITIFSICLLLFLSSTTLSHAQSNNTFTPPNRVQANFNAKYPNYSGATKWEETADGYQATLRQNKKEVVSNFDSDGRWVRSRTEVKENDLPEAAKQYIKDSYEASSFQSGYLFDTKNGSRYEVDIRSQNRDYRLEFDKNGAFVKEGTPATAN